MEAKLETFQYFAWETRDIAIVTENTRRASKAVRRWLSVKRSNRGGWTMNDAQVFGVNNRMDPGGTMGGAAQRDSLMKH